MTNEAINWHCPYCEHKVTITKDRSSVQVHILNIGNSKGTLSLATEFRVCPNQDCRKPTLTARLLTSPGMPKTEWMLIPDSDARTFPDYVPQAIRDDYREGCLIRDLSPKASATLARRTLQGILRDFYRVKPGRLVDEIAQLKDTIEPELWDAIEGVRKVGNIGAHMEKDIDVIVDVDPNEAQVLLKLVETMIEETYVHRAHRQARLARVTAIAADKRTPSSGSAQTTARGSNPA